MVASHPTANGNQDFAEREKGLLDEEAVALMRRSVVQPRTEAEGVFPPLAIGDQSIFFLAQAADEFMPWGRQPKYRDRQLREFWPTEHTLAGALYGVAGRNAGFSWDVEGPPRTASRLHDMLLNANMGEGWLDFITKLSIDLYTQDNGAFVEIVRERDSPDAPVVGINHLDSWRCWHTGIPEAPVLYEDRKGGRHLLAWYEVATIADMPTPIETLYGLQYSALTRALKAAQIARNIDIYEDEKTGGKHDRALVLVRGLSTSQISSAIAQQRINSQNRGELRFSMPPIIGTVDPAVELQVETIDFVSMPDGYDKETQFTHYMASLALAFGVDYQDLAPLPGGNLGTSTQSQILHLKSRGKGPAHFMKLIVSMLNQMVMPANCEFVWREQDEEADKTKAEIKKLRAETRKIQIDSGEITPAVARSIAHDEGDLDEEYLVVLGSEDLTPDVVLEDDRPTDTQIGNDNAAKKGTAPEDQANPNPPSTQPATGAVPPQFTPRQKELAGELVQRITAPLAAAEKGRVVDFLQTRIHKVFTMAADDLAAMGYMDTATRIDLSSVIGDSLKVFAYLAGERIPHLVEEELGAADARALVEAIKESSADDAIEQVEPERLMWDEAFAEKLAPMFSAMRADVTKKLRALE